MGILGEECHVQSRLLRLKMLCGCRETLVQLNTCRQLANVTAVDVLVSLDSSLQPAEDFSPAGGGIQITEISPGSLCTPHETQQGQLFSFRDKAGQEIRGRRFVNQFRKRCEGWMIETRGRSWIQKKLIGMVNKDVIPMSVIAMVMDECMPGDEQCKWKQRTGGVAIQNTCRWWVGVFTSTLLHPFARGSKKMQLSLTSSFRFCGLQWPKILHLSVLVFFSPGVKTSICVWRMWRSWFHKWPQLSKSKNKTSVMIHNSSLPFAFCAWGDAWQNSEAWPRFRGGEAFCDILAHNFSTPFFNWCTKWSRLWGLGDLNCATREYFYWETGSAGVQM